MITTCSRPITVGDFHFNDRQQKRRWQLTFNKIYDQTKVGISIMFTSVEQKDNSLAIDKLQQLILHDFPEKIILAIACDRQRYSHLTLSEVIKIVAPIIRKVSANQIKQDSIEEAYRQALNIS